MRAHTSIAAVGFAAALTVLAAVQASAAFSAYMTVEGVAQGRFRGESPREATRDTIPLLDYHYEVQAPRDVATGQATGRRMHKPLVITKEWGAATPQFMQALANNENLRKVVILFVRTNANGEEEVFQTIKLTDASVASIKHLTAGGPDDPRGWVRDSREVEEIAFTFRRIEISNSIGKTMAMDDWQR
jgi:type VI secretion system secreted protein Hcp